MRIIGLKHNILYRHIDPYSQRNFELLGKTGSNSIEIDCHSYNDISRLDEILPYIENFEYITLHLPNDLIYENTEKVKIFLKKIETFYNKSRAVLAIVHPDKIIEPRIFNDFDIKWAVENMDASKNSFINIEDFKQFFSNYKHWLFALDISHCFSLDNSLELAERFLKQFKDRIAEIHLSGFNDNMHVPLCVTKQTALIDICKNTQIPIIIESVMSEMLDIDNINKEYNYVVSHFH